MQHYDPISTVLPTPSLACVPGSSEPRALRASLFQGAQCSPPMGHHWGSSGRARDVRIPGASRQRNPLWALACCSPFAHLWKDLGRREEAHSKSPGCQATDLDFQGAWPLLCLLPLNTEPRKGQYLGLCSGQRLRNQTPQRRSHSLQLLLGRPPWPAPATVQVLGGQWVEGCFRAVHLVAINQFCFASSLLLSCLPHFLAPPAPQWVNSPTRASLPERC